MRVEGSLEVVQAAYRLDGDEPLWLEGIAEAAAALDSDRLGLMVAAFRLSAAGFERTNYVTTGAHGEAYAAMDATNREHFPMVHHGTECTMSTEAAAKFSVPWGTVEQVWGPLLYSRDVRDSFNVQGANARSALSIMVARRESSTPAERTREVWSRVAVHLSAAIRLRDALGGTPQKALTGAPVILDETGTKVLQAEKPAHSHLDSIRAAATRIDRARRSMQHDPERALGLWQGLVAGRWSIVQVIDTDRRRLLVARENGPDTHDDLRLTRRERQIVRLIGGGQSETLTAYALGLSTSTVRVHLGRALRKLGLGSAAELAAIVFHLGAARGRDA